jgi:DNA-binding NarL/FixJ family response regulator
MNMPFLDGAGVIEAVKKLNSNLKVVVLSMYDDEAIFLKCKKLGADAYILKNADSDELIYTIKEVHEGTHIMSFQKVLRQNMDEGYSDYYKQKFKLTKREIQLVRMIKKGMTNKEIAENLNLSVHTIDAHRKKIHSKLGVNSVAELVKKAFDLGI